MTDRQTFDAPTEPRNSEDARRGCVLVKGSGGGGLGDALRSVLLGLLYAESCNRVVVVDWRHGLFGPEGHNIFPELFELLGVHGHTSLEEWLQSSSVKPKIWRSNLDKSMATLWDEHAISAWDRDFARKSFSFDHSKLHKEEVCVMWDFDDLNRYSLAEIQSCLRSLLMPTASIQQQRDAFIKEHFKGPMLGVHIRAAKEKHVQQMLSSPAAIQAEVDRLLNLHSLAGIFLATDHQPTQEWFLHKYPGTVVRQKLFNPSGLPLHLSEYGQSKAETTKDALIDMLLLASCQALLYPISSSFSQCAGYFSQLTTSELHTLTPKRSLVSRVARRIRAALHRGQRNARQKGT